MDRKRRLQVERFYRSAQERTPRERSAFLSEVCQGDEELRREIEALLARHTPGDGGLDRPAVVLPDDSTVAPSAVEPCRPDPLAAGTLLAERFRIVRKVGAGGMGSVYEAVDGKLDRRVALKFAKPGHKNRLPPEVRAAREVSHFNVCKVHDLHLASTPLGEMEFLSMELIDGQTLSGYIDRQGPVPRSEAREIARQICAGLAQAHSQGVIHGDLKCGNVMLVRPPRGGIRAAIMDFGLA